MHGPELESNRFALHDLEAITEDPHVPSSLVCAEGTTRGESQDTPLVAGGEIAEQQAVVDAAGHIGEVALVASEMTEDQRAMLIDIDQIIMAGEFPDYRQYEKLDDTVSLLLCNAKESIYRQEASSQMRHLLRGDAPEKSRLFEIAELIPRGLDALVERFQFTHSLPKLVGEVVDSPRPDQALAVWREIFGVINQAPMDIQEEVCDIAASLSDRTHFSRQVTELAGAGLWELKGKTRAGAETYRRRVPIRYILGSDDMQAAYNEVRKLGEAGLFDFESLVASKLQEMVLASGEDKRAMLLDAKTLDVSGVFPYEPSAVSYALVDVALNHPKRDELISLMTEVNNMDSLCDNKERCISDEWWDFALSYDDFMEGVTVLRELGSLGIEKVPSWRHRKLAKWLGESQTPQEILRLLVEEVDKGWLQAAGDDEVVFEELLKNFDQVESFRSQIINFTGQGLFSLNRDAIRMVLHAESPDQAMEEVRELRNIGFYDVVVNGHIPYPGERIRMADNVYSSAVPVALAQEYVNMVQSADYREMSNLLGKTEFLEIINSEHPKLAYDEYVLLVQGGVFEVVPDTFGLREFIVQSPDSLAALSRIKLMLDAGLTKIGEGHTADWIVQKVLASEDMEATFAQYLALDMSGFFAILCNHLNVEAAKDVFIAAEHVVDIPSFMLGLRDAVNIFGRTTNYDVIEGIMALRDGTDIPQLFADMGVTATGVEGIEQLRQRARQLQLELMSIDEGTSNDEMILQHRVALNLFKRAVHIGESLWGKNDDASITAKVQARVNAVAAGDMRPMPVEYIASQVVAMHERVRSEKPAYSVETIGQYRRLREEIAVACSEGVNNLVAAMETHVQDQIEELQESISKPPTSLQDDDDKLMIRSQNIEKSIAKLNLYIERTAEYKREGRRFVLDDPAAFAEFFGLMAAAPALRSSIRSIAFAQAIRKHPFYKERMMQISPEINDSDLGVLREFVEHITLGETFKGYFSGKHHKKLASNFRALMSTAELRQTKTNGTAESKRSHSTLQLVPTRGLMMEFSGQIGHACWADEQGLISASMPNMTTLIMQQNPGTGDEKLVGSAMLIETTDRRTKEPIMVLRGVNPTIDYINAINVGEFYDFITGYVKQIAEARGMRAAIVIDDYSGGATTNRPVLYDYLKGKRKDLTKVSVIKADSTFNGYDISNHTYLL